ncbi:MAG: aminoacetone oxidase family FAD-binding enzyme, partial [Lachnospiraceae bacterium]
MSKVLVVGGGAAGMFAGIFAARNGHEVHLYEKNDKLGKKLFITGKGRCNITNAGDMESLFSSVVSNSKFLYSAFYGFTNFDVIDFFEEIGVPLKIERGNRVFPCSDHSSDVIYALTQELKRTGVHIHLNQTIQMLQIKDGTFASLQMSDGNEISGDKCIVATGGCSYQLTGSTGDGYRFAKDLGHQISPLIPSLVPLNIKEPYIKALQGLSLRNVTATIYADHKEIYQEFGEMLFTHYGVSGPLILSASSYIGEILKQNHNKEESYKKDWKLVIDLKPALSFEQLDQRILRDFEDNMNKQFKNAITRLFPAKLLPIMLELSPIDPDKKVHVISKEERHAFVELIK